MSSHKITFRERGEGRPLLLLHGYGGSVHHWEQVAENLKSSFRVVVPNLSHIYMGTDKLFFSVQVEVLAEFIRTHFPRQKICVTGMSYGGALAWALSLQHPELVEKLVLVNPMVPHPVSNFSPAELRYFFVIPLNLKSIYFLFSTPIGKAFLHRSAEIFRDERTDGVLDIANLKGRKLMFVAHMIHRFSWLLRTADWNDWQSKMKTAKVESLMIYDRTDFLFSPDVYKNFAKDLRCDHVIDLTGAGHLATKTRPETISTRIQGFLTDTVKAAG